MKSERRISRNLNIKFIWADSYRADMRRLLGRKSKLRVLRRNGILGLHLQTSLRQRVDTAESNNSFGIVMGRKSDPKSTHTRH